MNDLSQDEIINGQNADLTPTSRKFRCKHFYTYGVLNM
jgi:hypothetical protein